MDLLRCVLNKVSREKSASSSRARALRLESLENRELLDAAGFGDAVGFGDVATPPEGNGVPLEVAPERVDQPVDLSALATDDDASVLAAPEIFEIDFYDVETEKLAMHWTCVDDAEGYRVEYSTNGGKSWKFGGNADGDVDVRMASKVHTDIEYVFRIQAFNETSVSEWTYSQTFYCASQAPKSPQEFRLGQFDSDTNTLTMEWDKVDYSSGYRVQYSVDGGMSWYNSETLVGEDSTSRTAWKLYADREYQFRVCAYNEIGSSEWTYSDKFCVNNDELETPASVMIGSYDDTSRTLETTWSAVDNATGYEVQFSLDRGKTWRLAQKVYGGDNTSRLATHVIPGTTYEFRVRAFNVVGMSDWTYSDLYTPPAILTAPAFLNVDSYDPLARQLSLSWGGVSDVEGYKIEYSTDGGANWTVAFKAEADATSGVAEGIVANVNYIFHVRAYDATDVSPWTETSFFFGTADYDKLNAGI